MCDSVQMRTYLPICGSLFEKTSSANEKYTYKKVDTVSIKFNYPILKISESLKQGGYFKVMIFQKSKIPLKMLKN